MSLRCSLLTLLLLLSATANAGVVITAQDTTITEGGSGFVDFYIRSDGASVTGPDLLGLYTSEFLIEQDGNPNQLKFLPTAVPAAQTPWISPPEYVFNPLGLRQGGPAIPPSVTFQSYPGDTIVIGDSYAPPIGPPFLVLPLGDRLLARLNVTTLVGANAPIAGDKFDVTLLKDSLQTAFVGLGPLSLNEADSDLVATVTIAAANVIPEPSSACVWAAVCGLGLVRRRRRS